MTHRYTRRFRVRLAIERRRLRLSEWAYRWRHWSDASLPLDDPTPVAVGAELRHPITGAIVLQFARHAAGWTPANR